jgi:hypothetical protein
LPREPEAPSDPSAARPFPDSLCHECAAPPRYVTSDRGTVFVYCPVFRQYPPQPVLTCARFERRDATMA